MSLYKSYFDKTKCMYFMTKDGKMFDKYMTVWEKVRNITKNKFKSELIYNILYI